MDRGPISVMIDGLDLPTLQIQLGLTGGGGLDSRIVRTRPCQTRLFTTSRLPI